MDIPICKDQRIHIYFLVVRTIIEIFIAWLLNKLKMVQVDLILPNEFLFYFYKLLNRT